MVFVEIYSRPSKGNSYLSVVPLASRVFLYTSHTEPVSAVVDAETYELDADTIFTQPEFCLGYSEWPSYKD